ncbi:hypothetical protein P43SY_004094 [Pythium insidiosum]|uniref:Succinate-semialdehyde dehydrogenase, mitochondrial n=1 Tax=Pythium insidiosum TaxID=114742 RepID=A0AAD5LZ79_PYTIN|nr:hypothetical protein P43SY_004094 [Pythium insidiosum]
MLRWRRAAAVQRQALSRQRRFIHSEVKNTELLRTQGLINGQWVEAQSEAHFSVMDPSTDREVARVTAMGQEETVAAIQAAKDAFRTWKKTTPHARSVLLKKWHDAIRKHAEDLALITSAECGKPLAEAKGEVAYAAGFIDFYAHEIMHSAGFMVPTSVRGMQMMAVKEPVGVCGIITPWNFPLAMITRKLGPLLAAGCTAVVKPAAETPLSALALAKLAQDVGIPSGVINVVPAPVEKAAEIGETLSTHPDVRKLSFTGSTRVGKLLMQQSASTVKRLSLELGGNAPFIVFEDADVAAAVDGLIASKFRNTGQTCVCSNRVFIHESIAKEFTAALVERVEKLKLGPPRAPGVQLGPLISPAAFQKTRALVADALSHGATALTGGAPAPHLGANFFEPTVLVNVNDSMRIAHEEIFGPVVPLFTFRDEADVVARANGTDAGLAGYFYSRDLSRVWRVAAALEVGMVGVNTGSISNVQAPFGGVKQSGLGREGSFVGLDEYVETKLIYPWTQEEVAQVAAMDKDDAESAIRAASCAFQSWCKTSPRMRSDVLQAWHASIVDHCDALALLTTAESGKPINEAKCEVMYAASFVNYYAHECMRSAGFVVPYNVRHERMLATVEPVGVCAIITPWNFPLAMITRKLAPCIAAGCTAVVRPASETSLSALALAWLAQQAGVPSGVVNVLPSPHDRAAELGEALATSDVVRKLSFTGSTSVGRSLMQQSAASIKRVSLELGGNAPFIVFEDADLDAAVDALVASKFRNDGQTCVCSNRIFVHASVFETVKQLLIRRMQALTVGSPFATTTQLGPLINAKTLHKVQAIVQDAVDHGATVAMGGHALEQQQQQHGANAFAPTILVDVKDTMRVFHDEIFGPVVPLFSFDSERDVLERANATLAGLAGYFFTRDLARAWRVAAALECGMVGVNTAQVSNAQAPFGGVKQSGLGREGSFLGLHEYQEVKLINMGGLV